MDKRGFLDLIISLLPGLCLKDRICLCEYFAREEDLFSSSKTDIEKILGHGLELFWVIDTIRAIAERNAEICRMRSINWVSWNQEAYPQALREIFDPPAGLFFRGQLPGPQKSLLAMVGTRRPSPEA